VSTVEHLKAELLSIWMKRLESMESEEGNQVFDGIADNLIKGICQEEPGFSSYDFYEDNFEEHNPYMENIGR
jgi:hypothetical protein